MVKLTTEYTDIKNIQHKVEHIIPKDDENVKERIAEELCNILSKTAKIPA